MALACGSRATGTEGPTAGGGFGQRSTSWRNWPLTQPAVGTSWRETSHHVTPSASTGPLRIRSSVPSVRQSTARPLRLGRRRTFKHCPVFRTSATAPGTSVMTMTVGDGVGSTGGAFPSAVGERAGSGGGDRDGHHNAPATTAPVATTSRPMRTRNTTRNRSRRSVVAAVRPPHVRQRLLETAVLWVLVEV